MQACTECNATLPITEFYDRVRWQGGKHLQCRECTNFHRWVRKLIEASVPPPEACYVCGRTDLKLEIDHDHEKAEVSNPIESYRGHCCHGCNLRKSRRIGEAATSRVA